MDYPFEKLFLVCTGASCDSAQLGKDCGAAIREELKDINKKMGRKPTVRVTSVGCLDMCDHGPNMVVWPQGTIYSHLTRELGAAAYRGEMGDGPLRKELELDQVEFQAGGSAAVKR